MRWNIFHILSCHLYIFLNEMSIQIFCPFFQWEKFLVFFFYCWAMRFLCIFGIPVSFLNQIMGFTSIFSKLWFVVILTLSDIISICFSIIGWKDDSFSIELPFLLSWKLVSIFAWVCSGFSLLIHFSKYLFFHNFRLP